jgi:hypothetical protein
MSKNLIKLFPQTRINDLFVKPGSSLDFSTVNGPYKDPIIQGKPYVDHRVYADFYKKIGVDIVVETTMSYPYNFITEKTYRPIANGRPFIIVGPKNTLSFLKSLGFLTFSSIINESYDSIDCPEKRFLSVSDAILTFVNRPLDQVINDIRSVNNILEHNQICLKNLIDVQFEHFKKQINA